MTTLRPELELVLIQAIHFGLAHTADEALARRERFDSGFVYCRDHMDGAEFETTYIWASF